MPTKTIFIARAFGIFMIAFVIGIGIRGTNVIYASVADGQIVLLHAILTLAFGAAMVVGHNIWRGGLLPIVVTLIGWLSFLKGIALLLLPTDAMLSVYRQTSYERYGYYYLVPSLLLGIYLVWAGFSASRSKQAG